MTSRSHHNEHGIPKRAWPTYVEAERFAQLLMVTGKSEKRLQAYPCEDCHRWHIGERLSANGLLRAELGERAYLAVMLENSTRKGPSRRRWHVRQRAIEASKIRRAA